MNTTSTGIQFISEIKGFRLKNKERIKKWVLSCITKEKGKAGAICFVFCDDKHLSRLNIEYLKHKTLTDIITFDYSEKKELLSAELYISTQRVKENAGNYGTGFDNELQRVMIHGILHLLGYKDRKPAEKKRMRQKEDFYLHLFRNQSKKT